MSLRQRHRPSATSWAPSLDLENNRVGLRLYICQLFSRPGQPTAQLTLTISRRQWVSMPALMVVPTCSFPRLFGQYAFKCPALNFSFGNGRLGRRRTPLIPPSRRSWRLRSGYVRSESVILGFSSMPYLSRVVGMDEGGEGPRQSMLKVWREGESRIYHHRHHVPVREGFHGCR